MMIMIMMIISMMMMINADLKKKYLNRFYINFDIKYFLISVEKIYRFNILVKIVIHIR